MIDYAVLCRAIEDWKSGHAPRSAPPPRPPPRPGRAPAPKPIESAATNVPNQQAMEDRTMIYQLPELVEDDN